jgi:hypothetical protein
MQCQACHDSSRGHASGMSAVISGLPDVASGVSDDGRSLAPLQTLGELERNLSCVIGTVRRDFLPSAVDVVQPSRVTSLNEQTRR